MTAATPSTSRKIIITILKLLVAVALLAWLYTKCGKDLAELRNRTIIWRMLAAALGIRLVSLFLTFSRWRLLVAGIGIPLSFREAFRLGMLGEACNLMGPGAVGGDLIKAGLLAKDHPKRIASVLATVFLDRVLGLWSLFVLGAIASLIPVSTKLGPEMQIAVWGLWGGSAAGLIGMGLMFVPAFTHSRLMHWLTTWKFVGRVVKELMDSIQMYQGRPQTVIACAALGLLGHFGFLTTFFYCAEALHSGQPHPGLIDHVVGLPLPEALSALIPMPGGVGVLEGGVGWFYQQYQVSLNPDSTEAELKAMFGNGVLTALGFRLTIVAWGAVGLVYYLLSRKEIAQAVKSVETEPTPMLEATS